MWLPKTVSFLIYREGVDAFDAHLKMPVKLCTEVSAFVTDYAMMSHVCNHMGPSAKKFCPKCNVSSFFISTHWWANKVV